MRNTLQICSLIFVWLAGVACSALSGAEAAGAPVQTPAPRLEVLNSGDLLKNPVLIWEGHTEFGDGDKNSCKSLLLAADNQGLLGPCGAAQTRVQLNQEREWAEILARFAPFQYATPDERLVFQGAGLVAGPAWQRAIATWTRFTYAELLAGRASASGRTVLSWWLGEIPDQPGYCAHLVVLAYGYAYSNIELCEGGGPPQRSNGGWLETDEWEPFDAWLYSRGSVYQDNNYFSGIEGLPEMSQSEVDQLAQWTQAVYTRLAN